jgi:hypothetical protein
MSSDIILDSSCIFPTNLQRHDYDFDSRISSPQGRVLQASLRSALTRRHTRTTRHSCQHLRLESTQVLQTDRVREEAVSRDIQNRSKASITLCIHESVKSSSHTQDYLPQAPEDMDEQVSRRVAHVFMYYNEL